MTLVLPQVGSFVTSASLTSFLINDANAHIAWRFRADAATSITDVWVRWAANSGSPGDCEIVLEGDASGVPDGTDVGGGSPTLLQFTPTASSTDKKTFTNGYTPAVAEYLWVVLRPKAAEQFDGSHFRRVSYRHSTYNRTVGHSQGKTSADGGSSWSTPILNASAGCSLLYTGGAFVSTEYLGVITSMNFEQWDDADSPDERGVAWAVPAGMTCKVHGVGLFYRPLAAAATFTLDVLENTTSKYSLAVDPAVIYTQYNASNALSLWFEQGPYSLAAGSTGRITIRATHASSTIRLPTLTFEDQATRESCKGFAPFYKTSRDGGSGAFSDDLATWPQMLPWLELEAVGGGGPPIIQTRRNTLIGR